MKDLLSNDAFLGVIGVAFGAFMTYLGVRTKAKNDKDAGVTSIYTEGVQDVIKEYKEQRAELRETVEKLTEINEEQKELIDQLRDALEQNNILIEHLKTELSAMRKITTKKDAQISKLETMIKNQTIK